jgi:hypothetical protein
MLTNLPSAVSLASALVYSTIGICAISTLPDLYVISTVNISYPLFVRLLYCADVCRLQHLRISAILYVAIVFINPFQLIDFLYLLLVCAAFAYA